MADPWESGSRVGRIVEHRRQNCICVWSGDSHKVKKASGAGKLLCGQGKGDTCNEGH